MKIFVENETEREPVSVKNYFEKVLDKVIDILSDTRDNLDTNSDMLNTFNVLFCKNRLDKLLHNVTDYDDTDESE